MEDLKAQIKIVAEARDRAREANCERVASYNKWVEANQPLLDNESRAKTVCLEAESALRELTLDTYVRTGNKAPAPGVGIREVTKLDYDMKVAFDWALHHEIALKLDIPAFEKIAKVSPPSFVTIYQEPQATIATQLDIF